MRSIPVPAGVVAVAICLAASSASAAAPCPSPPVALGPTAWEAFGDSIQASFGYIVVPAGDVDGDGLTDLLVGAPAMRLGSSGNVGKAFLFKGIPGGFEAMASWSTSGRRDNEYLGATLDAAGDVNGDGFGDVIIGHSFATPLFSPYQRVQVFLGSAMGLRPAPDWEVTAVMPAFQLGAAVAGIGDVNGDGLDDIAYDTKVYGASGTHAQLRIHHGSPSGLRATPDTVLEWEAGVYPGDRAICGVGDVNGDSYDDVVFNEAAMGTSGRSLAFLHLGSPLGLSPIAAWIGEPPLGSDAEASVAALGDVDGDGFADVLIGASSLMPSLPSAGRASIFRGRSDGLDPTPSWTAVADATFAFLGLDVAAAGDLDGDGFADILVSAMGPADASGRPLGAVLAFFGGSCGIEPEPGAVALGDQPYAWFGSSIAGLGDIDGDGLADFAVSSPVFTDDQYHEGRVRLYSGAPRSNHPPRASAGPDVAVDCGSVSLVGEAPDPEGDIVTVQWTSSCADAVFVPGADVLTPTMTFDAGCSRECTVTLTADDGRSGVATCSATVIVADRTPPTIDAGTDSTRCLWPPNGKWQQFSLDDLVTGVTDACDPAPTVLLVGCVVAEGLGRDAELVDECRVIDAGRTLLVRARRSGQAKDGRRYTVLAVTEDACGNASGPTPAAEILVPHDRREGEACAPRRSQSRRGSARR